ncbi:MAG: tetratricopeptide repeat protein [Alphaproteobacteria bacterium]|jgi:Flp pilus assembly protein TadD
MAIRWKFVLPIIGLGLAFTVGRMVADWSTDDTPAEPLEAGFQAFQAGRFSQAELMFERARRADPERGDAYHGLALVALEKRRDLKQAEALFREAIAAPDTSPVAFANFGRFLINEQRYGEAIAVLEQGVARDPDFDPARARLAIALYADGRLDDACRVARSIADPPDAEEGLIERIREDPGCVTR